MPGEPADRGLVTRTAEAADALAAFLAALHQPAPEEVDITGGGRRGPMAGSSEWVAQQLAEATEMGLIPDPDAVRAVWEDAAAAPDWAGSALWLHGDPHPANVLTADGTADRFYGTYQPTPDAAALRRARGWAVNRALGGLHVGEAGVHGRPGGKATWGPPAHAAPQRLIATAPR
ncbi:phosphotransferase [Nonomuraea angiospora]|uniref:phosphotransferase n=1 Tax=Nonomuraea angiospora TaxID=46172 RepID=UPI00332E2410